MNNLNKDVATLYILCYEMEVASLPEQKDQRKAIRDDKSAVVPINLIIKNIPKWFYQCYRLPCSFKIFINLFAFLYAVKSNFKEICEEMFFSSFFSEKCCCQHCWDSIISKNWVVTPFFSSWIPTALAKILFFPRGLNLAQKLLYLVFFLTVSWKTSHKLNILKLLLLSDCKYEYFPSTVQTTEDRLNKSFTFAFAICRNVRINKDL